LRHQLIFAEDRKTRRTVLLCGFEMSIGEQSAWLKKFKLDGDPRFDRVFAWDTDGLHRTVDGPMDPARAAVLVAQPEVLPYDDTWMRARRQEQAEQENKKVAEIVKPVAGNDSEPTKKKWFGAKEKNRTP
jgi:hypothetical protein